jgi:aminoglycoside/choline kinase family phosphotransferase
MIRVAILPIPTQQGDITYCAVAGDKHTQGRTAGEALDALSAQLPEDETGTLIIVQSRHPDRFFEASQQQRLAELMERWRVARDQGDTLAAAEQAELEAAVEAELQAAAKRTAVLVDKLRG